MRMLPTIGKMNSHANTVYMVQTSILMTSLDKTQSRKYPQHRNNAGRIHQFTKSLVKHSEDQNDCSEYPDHVIHSLLALRIKPLFEKVNFGAEAT